MTEQETAPRRGLRTWCWLPLAAELLCLILPTLLGFVSEDAAVAAFTPMILAATCLGVFNIAWAVWLGMKGEVGALRLLGVWGKAVTAVLLTLGLLVTAFALLVGGILLTMLMGLLGIMGVGFFGFVAFCWFYLMGLVPSAYLAAFLWAGVRAGRVRIPKAVVQTILQFIPVVDVIAAIVLFFTTRPARGAQGAGPNLPAGDTQEVTHGDTRN